MDCYFVMHFLNDMNNLCLKPSNLIGGCEFVCDILSSLLTQSYYILLPSKCCDINILVGDLYLNVALMLQHFLIIQFR